MNDEVNQDVSEEAAPESTVRETPPSEDRSTLPPTAPVPTPDEQPGVTGPVNIEPTPGAPPLPIMRPERIGEATRP